MGIEVVFVILLIVAVFVAYAAERFNIPYTVALVLTGLGVSFFHLNLGELTEFELEPELILVTFLPGLLFEAGYKMDGRLFRANARTIMLLAIPGVIISAALIGGLLSWLVGLPIVIALLFGILITPTDPVAVTALFKELGVDKRLGIIVEGESLFNDGVSIVLFNLIVGIAAGATVDIASGVGTMVITILGGFVFGGVAGIIFSTLMKNIDEPTINIALTTILAYGLYLLVEESLHGIVSPVIAVVVASTIVGTRLSSESTFARSSEEITTFWEFIGFLINSVIFLLIGLQINLEILIDYGWVVLLGIGIVLLSRFITIYLLRFWANAMQKQEIIPLKWAHVLFWGGLKGAVSMALVLSLPPSLESRELLTVMAFGYVLFSLVIQGLTVKPVLKWIGLTGRTKARHNYERLVAHTAIEQGKIDAIDRMEANHLITHSFAGHLKHILRERIEEDQKKMTDMVREEPSLVSSNMRRINNEMGSSAKQALRRLGQQGTISEEIMEEFINKVDQQVLYIMESGENIRAELKDNPDLLLQDRIDLGLEE